MSESTNSVVKALKQYLQTRHPDILASKSPEGLLSQCSSQSAFKTQNIELNSPCVMPHRDITVAEILVSLHNDTTPLIHSKEIISFDRNDKNINSAAKSLLSDITFASASVNVRTENIISSNINRDNLKSGCALAPSNSPHDACCICPVKLILTSPQKINKKSDLKYLW